KLNPTLLGRETVDGLLHDVLGYDEVRTRPRDFEKDLQWGQALEITDRLSELARSRGRTFQVKLSNTLVVENHRPFFPASEAVMYLSGEPLHVITLNLVEKYRRARPAGPLQAALAETLRSDAVDLAGVVARSGPPGLYDELVRVAALLNTPVVVERATRDPRYRAEANRKPPRKVGSRLALFDCIN